MNEIKLSGFLFSEVRQHRTQAGVSIASAQLRFNPHGDSVLLVAVDSRTRQLTACAQGAHIRVIGRLAIYKEGFVILVDEVGTWKAATSPPKFAYDESLAQRSIRELGQDFPME